MESDGRTTIMMRNIPNKYTQDMLLELFEKNHKKKFDFFYLPIDYNVDLCLFRTIVMLATLLSTSSIQSSLLTSIRIFIRESGTSSTLSKSVKYATLEFKELLN